MDHIAGKHNPATPLVDRFNSELMGTNLTLLEDLEARDCKNTIRKKSPISLLFFTN